MDRNLHILNAHGQPIRSTDRAAEQPVGFVGGEVVLDCPENTGNKVRLVMQCFATNQRYAVVSTIIGPVKITDEELQWCMEQIKLMIRSEGKHVW